MAITQQELNKILDDLRHNRVTNLNLPYQGINTEQAMQIAAALKDNKSLTKLYLMGNQIGDAGAKEIAAALKDNKSLTKLHLGGNKIGDEGAKDIAAALKVNESLTKLYLWGNKIGAAGAKEIAAALKDNKSLTELGLGDNQIGDAGAKDIAAALKDNKSLTELDLGGNKIGDEGAKDIAAALKVNESLTKLYLWGNKIGAAGAKEIADALKVNKSLTKLDLRNNQIGDELQSQIQTLIQRNCQIRDNFLALTKKAITDSGQLVKLKTDMQETVTPLAHQIYALGGVVKEAGELGKEGGDIAGHLTIMRFLLDRNVPVNKDVLEMVREINDPQISALIESVLNVSQSVRLNSAAEEQMPVNSTSSGFSLSSSSPQPQLELLKTQLKDGHLKIEELTKKQEQGFAKIAQLQEAIRNIPSSSPLSAAEPSEAEAIKIKGLQKRITEIEAGLSQINPKHKLSPEDRTEIAHILARPHLKKYSIAVEKTFNEAFLAVGVLSSGQFKTKDQTPVQILEAISSVASGTPVAAAFLLLSSATGAVLDAKRDGELNNIVDLNPNSSLIDAASLSEKIARKLAISNEEEIDAVSQGKGGERLQGIKGYLANIHKSIMEASKKQVAKINDATARGLFGEELSSVELLALSNSKGALRYVTHQTPAEKVQTKLEVREGKYDSLIDRVVENALGKKVKRLSSLLVVDDKVNVGAVSRSDSLGAATSRSAMATGNPLLREAINNNHNNQPASPPVVQVVQRASSLSSSSSNSINSNEPKSDGNKNTNNKSSFLDELKQKQKGRTSTEETYENVASDKAKEAKTKRGSQTSAADLGAGKSIEMSGLRKQIARGSQGLKHVDIPLINSKKLLAACKDDGDLPLEAIRKLIKDGADVNYKDEDGRSLLDIVVSNNDINTFDLLNDNGAKITSHTIVGSVKNQEIRETLEKAEAEINTPNTSPTKTAGKSSQVNSGKDGCCVIS